MSAPKPLTPALWLDPFRPLSAADAARLACAGVKPIPVSTLDELQAQLTDTPTPLAMLDLGLGSDTSLLEDALLLLKGAQSTLPVVCRLERRHQILHLA